MVDHSKQQMQTVPIKSFLTQLFICIDIMLSKD